MIDTTATPGIGLNRLWAPDVPVRPGPRPRITLEGITSAAISIARSQGIAGVSMPEIASILGCSKMALYRHITDKGDLVSAMVDAAFSETPPALREPFDWRAQFTAVWDYLITIYTREIWIADLPSDTNLLTPNHLSWLESSLAMFAHSQLAAADQLTLMQFVSNAAKGEALRQLGEQKSGHQFELWVRDSDDVLAPAVTRERFPLLTAATTGATADAEPKNAFILEMILSVVGSHFAALSAGEPSVEASNHEPTAASAAAPLDNASAE
ncbi:TetR/AcrR family transcriptional regulator [Lysinibacter cavernae]|uniref:AcrR family transcriptional regulator n=1 Tax=Lysinibacter cavernae TaxID=1640652 RepID=A0A7X5R0E3_9MICO|nr:TetR/AcrR family transcriptional regulator [Lysinibacter cavernae]NIH53306.1 AcrR family transcriptional regulator [Lysinibacter cavernae]